MDDAGIKDDDSKVRFDLADDLADEEMNAVLTFGAEKYGPDNWRDVREAERRYYSALIRHLRAWRKGECLDGETRLRHLAHAACCVHFLLALDIERNPLPVSLGERLRYAIGVARAIKAKREAAKQGNAKLPARKGGEAIRERAR